MLRTSNFTENAAAAHLYIMPCLENVVLLLMGHAGCTTKIQSSQQESRGAQSEKWPHLYQSRILTLAASLTTKTTCLIRAHSHGQ